MSKNYKIHLGSRVADSYIKNSISEKLLGDKISKIFSFDEHVKYILKKANNKLRALAKATSYMDIGAQKLLLNKFFNAQLNY